MKNTKNHVTTKKDIKRYNFWFLIFMMLASIHANAQFIWEVRAPFSDPREGGGIEGAAAAIVDGTVYVSHGFRGSADTNLLSSYDIATDTWTHGGAGLPDAPGAVQSEMGGGTVDGIFYAMAGRNGPVADTRAFNPATSTWSTLSPMPTARGAPGFASANGLLYAIGGRDGTTIGTGNILSSNEVYNPVTDSWSVLTPLPIPVSDNYATVGMGTDIYVIGGSTGGGLSGAATDAVQIYDTLTDTWSSGTAMPTARKAHMAAEICGKITVFGGLASGASVNLDVTEIYDPITDTWTVGPPLPSPASEIAQGVVGNGKEAYLIGSGFFGAGEQFVFAMVAATDITVTVDDGNTTVNPGDNITYTIIVNNAGTVDAPALIVTDNFPAELGSVTWTCVAAGGATCTAAGSGDIADTVNLPAAGTVTYTVNATVVGMMAGSFDNMAVATTSIGCFSDDTDTDGLVIPMADLSISKIDSVDPVTAGNNLTYTITVDNAGPDAASNVTVTDILPAGVTFVSSVGCAEDPVGVPSCSLGAITAGGSAVYTVTVSVDSSTTGLLTNNASVVSTTADPNAANDSTSETTMVASDADLSIVKVDDVDPVNAGGNLVYTLTVNNAGPSDALNVVVTDALPAGVSFVSSSGCIEDPAGVPSCSLGNIISGGSAVYTVMVSVDSGTTGTITNNASVSSATTDSNAANDSTTENTVVSAVADLSISKVDSVDPVIAGNNLTYTITVDNAGPGDAQNVVVTDILPAGVAFVSTTGCVEDPVGIPNCSLGNIASGGSASYTVTVNVDANTIGTITNNASVSSSTMDPNAANDSTSEPTVVNASADLSISKVDDVDPVIAGNNLIYTLMVTNAGPSDALNVVATDILPAGVSFVSSAGCAEDPAGIPNCSLGTISAGGSAVYTVTVNVDSSTTGLLTNNASVASTTADPNAANDSTSETTMVASDADLSIVKIDDVDPVNAGGNLIYTLTVNNAGPSDALNVVVTDVLPAGVSFVSSSGCIEDPAGIPTCSLGNIASGGSAVYTVMVSVDSGTTGTITNNASVSSATTDSNAANDSTTENTVVSAVADLSISKVDSVDPVIAGNNLTYTITVDNAGPGDAQNVVVTDILPAGVSFVSTTGCVEDPAGAPTCSLGNIVSGGSASYTMLVTVGANTTGILNNIASVSSATTDPNAANDSTSEPTVVNASADLSINKVDDVDPVIAGNNLVYTLMVNNAGPSDAQNVVVTETLPAGVTFVSSAGCAEDPTGIPSCSLGAIASGGSAVYTVTVSVDSSTTGVLTNNASVASTTTDPNAANDSTSETTTVASDADLSVVKVDDVDPVNAGGNLVYTLTVNNAGPSDAQNVVVADILPAGVTFVSSSGCIEDPAGVPTCSLGNIVSGGSAAYTVMVSVDSGTTGTITNNASVSSSTTDSNAANDSTTENTVVSAVADLSISKTDSVDPVIAGNNLVYTITVDNAGPGDAQNVVVADTLPAGVSFVSSTGCVEDPAGVPNCSLGNIASGGSVSYTVTVSVDASTTGTITNNASVSSATTDPNAANDSTSEPTVVNASADLSVSKVDDVDPVIAGNNLIYTITVDNAGPSDALNVVVTDALPTGVTLVSSAGCTEDPTGIPSCSLGTIAAGANASYTVTVSVDANTTGSLANSASVASTTTDPNSGNDSTTENTVVNTEADLSIAKVDDVDPVLAGNNLVYTITVDNAGPSDALNVAVADTLPAGVTFVSSTGCTEDPTGVPNCSLGTIASGGSTSYSVTITVDANTTGTLINNASVTSSTTDSNNTNNSTSENTVVSADADLSISKVDDVDPVNAGNNLVYTITVDNAGPSDAQNVVVADTLPAGVSFVSSTGCTEDPAGVPTCSLGNITAGGNASFTVTVSVDTNTTGTITNNASVSSSTADSNASNDSTSEDTAISSEADLSISKVDDVDPVIAGNNITYTITVDNAGPGDATNVVVTDTLPTGVTFISSTGCTEDPTGIPSCSLGTIAAGANASYTVTVSVDADTVGTISNNASVTSSATDPNPDNDTTTEGTEVSTEADLSIVKLDDVDPVLAGNNLVYTVIVDNAGPSDALNVVVTDLLPAGVTFVSSTGCTEDPTGVPTCSLGTIASGGSTSYAVTVTVDAGTTGTITNNVSVASTTNDPNSANDSATEDTTVSVEVDLSISKTDDVDPVTAGSNLVYTITVDNLGPSDALNVVVADTLPADVVFISSTGCVEDPSGVPNCTLGAIAAGSSAFYTVTVTVNPDASGTLTNTATVSTSSNDVNASNDTALEDTEISIGADLVLIKQASVMGSIEVGSVFDYVLTVTNNGPSNANGVVVTDNLPSNLSLVSTAGCAEDPIGVPTCTLADLAPLEQAQYTVTVMVEPSGTINIVNTANVESQTTDSVPSNNVSVATGVSILLMIPTLQWFGLLLLVGLFVFVGYNKFRSKRSSL